MGTKIVQKVRASEAARPGHQAGRAAVYAKWTLVALLLSFAVTGGLMALGWEAPGKAWTYAPGH